MTNSSFRRIRERPPTRLENCTGRMARRRAAGDRKGNRREGSQCARVLPRRTRRRRRLPNGVTKDCRIVSGTFMTSLVDSRGPASSRCSSTKNRSLARAEDERARLSRRQRDGNTFNMLRANDLIWSFVNNYPGPRPVFFDLLHWNSTRRACRRRCTASTCATCMKNLVARAGRHQARRRSDRSVRATIPTYFVSAIEDHIAPWKTTYAGLQLVGENPASCWIRAYAE